MGSKLVGLFKKWVRFRIDITQLGFVLNWIRVWQAVWGGSLKGMGRAASTAGWVSTEKMADEVDLQRPKLKAMGKVRTREADGMWFDGAVMFNGDDVERRLVWRASVIGDGGEACFDGR